MTIRRRCAEALEAYLDGVVRAEDRRAWASPSCASLEAQVMLRIIDTRWMAHLQEMDYLKTGIGLRAFGQRDPLVEYKNEAYSAFQQPDGAPCTRTTCARCCACRWPRIRRLRRCPPSPTRSTGRAELLQPRSRRSSRRVCGHAVAQQQAARRAQQAAGSRAQARAGEAADLRQG